MLQTVDPMFDELEQKLTSLEIFLRQLIRNVTTWQEDLQVCILQSASQSHSVQLFPPSLPPSLPPSRKSWTVVKCCVRGWYYMSPQTCEL